MKAKKDKVILTSGTRKRAVARARLKKGTGIVRINSKLLDNYTPEYNRLRIQEPLILGEKYADQVDIYIRVSGGGHNGQADACRLAIAQALVEFSKDAKLKKKYLEYDRHLLVADVRRREACKPNDSAPRDKRQKSYR
ncbi:30S ribosomal protein S9 [Candidatus Woesearchaeota archaeon]|nr:30S ribosomal protein S9 [Candidatus Woesearchaeota archaeon]MBW3014723.1 30S ribosomal protein S9 [Candidatus Woesearchaeota archaeon]